MSCLSSGACEVQIPPPVECPACRLQIRTAHRNEQLFYQDTSDLSGARMISLYAPAAPLISSLGWHWREAEQEEKSAARRYEIPDRIADVSEQIRAQVLTCAQSGLPYKITGPELTFYRQHQLPIPRQAPLMRHYERELLRNPRRMWQRTCHSCGSGMLTNFEPERPEAVYCEECFARAVF